MVDSLAARVLLDGRSLWVYPLFYGRARLVVGPLDADWYDDGW